MPDLRHLSIKDILMSHIVNHNKTRLMEAVDLKEWIHNEFLHLLDRYLTPLCGEEEGRPKFKDLYSDSEIYTIAFDCAMVSVMEHDNCVSDYAGWGDMIEALGDEETFNMFMADTFSPHSKGGIILAEIKERIDPEMPYVITGPRIYYILKDGLTPVSHREE